MKHIMIAVVRLYQLLISPALPTNSCRFYPSCSHYAIASLEKHGAWKGTWLAIRRISKCHPWNEGGYDPVV